MNAEMEEVKDPVQRPSFGVPHNPFKPQQQTQAEIRQTIYPAKKLVSIETLMRHTGSKEELHYLLTV